MTITSPDFIFAKRAYAHGMNTEAFADFVLSHPKQFNETIIKQADFIKTIFQMSAKKLRKRGKE